MAVNYTIVPQNYTVESGQNVGDTFSVNYPIGNPPQEPLKSIIVPNPGYEASHNNFSIKGLEPTAQSALTNTWWVNQLDPPYNATNGTGALPENVMKVEIKTNNQIGVNGSDGNQIEIWTYLFPWFNPGDSATAVITLDIDGDATPIPGYFDGDDTNVEDGNSDGDGDLDGNTDTGYNTNFYLTNNLLGFVSPSGPPIPAPNQAIATNNVIITGIPNVAFTTTGNSTYNNVGSSIAANTIIQENNVFVSWLIMPEEGYVVHKDMFSVTNPTVSQVVQSQTPNIDGDVNTEDPSFPINFYQNFQWISSSDLGSYQSGQESGVANIQFYNSMDYDAAYSGQFNMPIDPNLSPASWAGNRVIVRLTVGATLTQPSFNQGIYIPVSGEPLLLQEDDDQENSFNFEVSFNIESNG